MTGLAKELRGFSLDKPNHCLQTQIEENLTMLDNIIDELESSLMEIEDELFNRYISDNQSKISKTRTITLN